MKKFSILGLCLFAGLSMSAQMDLMKDVERTVKSGNFNYSEIKPQLDQITQNDETKNNVKAWMIAGNAAFANYDALFSKMQIGQDVDGKEAGQSLIDGYDYMIKALPLDSIETDKKGKIKAKESKKILKSIAENHPYFNYAGIMLWEAKDYAGAYRAWDIYTTLPDDPRMASVGLKHAADTIVSQIVYNKALAAWQINELDKALEAFEDAYAKGYDKKDLFDYAISVATIAQKNDVAFWYAQKAVERYGTENPDYIRIIISSYVNNKKYDDAKGFIQGLISKEPNNALYYVMHGDVLKNEGNVDGATELYKKAKELNPSLALAYYSLGMLLNEKASAIYESTTDADYATVSQNVILPLLKEASTELNKACELGLTDEEDYEARQKIQSIQYNIDQILGVK